jgi:nucleotide-binding universal stress UspA family protein
MNNILVAVDFSKYSSEVVKVAYSLAKKINASVTLVTIINKFINYMPVDTAESFADEWEARQHVANTNLLKIKEEYPEVETTIVSFIGDPKEDIIDLAVERHACFIVMGTHGRTGISNLLMGSTAEYIIRHSSIPIIVVPLKKTK